METSETSKNTDVSPEILKAFHLMWDTFPFAVLLLRKDRTILDCNQTAKDKGVRLGMKCYQLSGEKGIHKHCRGL